MDTGMEKGKLRFVLHGKKLKGEFSMVRSRFGSNQRGNQWLLMKKKDEFADEQFVLKRILDYGSKRDLQPPNTIKGKRTRPSTSGSSEPTTKKR